MDTLHPEADGPRQRLCRAFAIACEREDVRGTLREAAGALEVEFEGQENAPAALILHHFGLELAAAGIAAEALLHPDDRLAEAELERLVQGLDLAVRRIRVLLIEHNSFLSGGLPWVFPPPAQPLLAERGLSIYRYPKTAAVDVTAHGGAIRVAFAAGDLGPVTSSGFYVPTRIAGDFAATLRYDLRSWQPGPATASLALFAQDEPSLHRYYAQRNSGPGAAPHAALAHFNAMLWPGVRVAEPGGWFRLTRKQGRVRAWHRGASEGAFAVLGDQTGEPHADVFLGAKVWCQQASGGLVADFSGLVVEASLAAAQPPLPDVRPDPRRGTDAP